MTNLGPLTTTFTPIGPDCTSTFLGKNQGNGWVQYGAGPDASSACLPSHFNSFDPYFYSPGICPLGYTTACFSETYLSTRTEFETQATCCPTSYICRTSRGHDVFACISPFDGPRTFDVSFFSLLTDSVGSTTSIIPGTTQEVWPDNYIFAYGLVVHAASNNIISTSTSSDGNTSTGTPANSVPNSTQSSYSGMTATTPADSSRNQSPGLSQGAVAGIAVGSTLAGVLLIGTIVALFLRRRQRLSEVQPVVNVPETGDAQVKLQQDYPFPHNNGQQPQGNPYELSTRSEQMHPYELNAERM
ncbi:hypothetical protein F4801DRAFT_547891 [Xylaria longipes]|nr:hypothetical protein F4801DRAFT_547891 [Xylaria longipes]